MLCAGLGMRSAWTTIRGDGAPWGEFSKTAVGQVQMHTLRDSNSVVPFKHDDPNWWVVGLAALAGVWKFICWLLRIRDSFHELIEEVQILKRHESKRAQAETRRDHERHVINAKLDALLESSNIEWNEDECHHDY
jgi:hypothetical protein